MKDITIILLRFSDEEQIGGVSPEYQERVCREYETRTPYADGLPRKIVVLLDEAKSGTFVLERPRVKESLEFARAGRLARIIVWKWDRFARNEYEAFVAIKELEDLEVEVLSSTEGNEKIVRAVMLAVAAEESRKTTLRTRESAKQIALEGFPCGGPIPFGLGGVRVPDPRGRRDRKGNPKYRVRYVRDPDHAGIAEELFKLAANGWGDKHIAWSFNDRKLPSPTGRGQGWDSSAVKAIRENEKYKGTLVHGKRRFMRTKRGTRVFVKVPEKEWVVIDNCPNIESIVSAELWEQAQRLRDRRPGGGGRGPNPKYALSGLVKCGECGASMNASPSSRKGHRYLRLRCGFHIRRGMAICSNERVFSYEGVFDAILDVLHRDLFTHKHIQTLVDMVVEEIGTEASRADVNKGAAEGELRRTEAKLAKVVEAIEEAKESITVLLDRVKEHQKKIAAIRARLGERRTAIEVPKPEAVREHVMRAVFRIGEIVKKGSPPEVQAELHRHFNEIRMFRDGRLRAEGTLEGLLQGAPVVRNFGSGGGI